MIKKLSGPLISGQVPRGPTAPARLGPACPAGGFPGPRGTSLGPRLLRGVKGPAARAARLPLHPVHPVVVLSRGSPGRVGRARPGPSERSSPRPPAPPRARPGAPDRGAEG